VTNSRKTSQPSGWTKGYLIKSLKDTDGLKKGEISVFRSLIDCADSSAFCFPSIKRIAKETDYSERHVGRILKDLSDRGLIRRFRKKLDGQNRGYVSALTLPTGHPVQDIRHLTSKFLRQMSGQNNTILNNTKNGRLHPEREFEDAILNVFRTRIDFHKHWKLISVSQVTFWAHNESVLKFDEAAVLILREAVKCHDELVASRTMLESWAPLLRRLRSHKLSKPQFKSSAK